MEALAKSIDEHSEELGQEEEGLRDGWDVANFRPGFHQLPSLKGVESL